MNALTIPNAQAQDIVRTVTSSRLLRDTLLVMCAAAALAAAFPKVGAAWLVPFGTAALFWVWQGSSWKRAAVLGWVAGMVFFALNFAWVGHTVGKYIGVFGPFLAFGPAVIEAPFFALAGALSALAYARMQPAAAPLAAAAAFTIAEWLRSIGVLAAPFDQLGYTQADTPLAALAAYAGTYGITFALCVAGAYLADSLRRRTIRPVAIAAASVAIVTLVAWTQWPARHAAPPTIPVAAVQGNIPQSFKWNSLGLAIRRYTALTRAARRTHPKLVVWPETAITTELNFDQPLINRFGKLSRQVGATIVAGAIDANVLGVYNALYFISPNGNSAIYHKRQLVPFAEWFPGRAFLSWLPYIGALNGGLQPGRFDGVYSAGKLRVAPLICWESAFADLAYAQVRAGAQLLVISTDDAWFGATSGPYMHAQIAQLRAIESGTYVVRAAATGISGIIAPDGRWLERSRLDQRTVVTGRVGPRVPTVFSRIGPTSVALALVALYALLFAIPRRTQPREAEIRAE